MSDADASPPAPRRSQRDKKQVDRFVPENNKKRKRDDASDSEDSPEPASDPEDEDAEETDDDEEEASKRKRKTSAVGTKRKTKNATKTPAVKKPRVAKAPAARKVGKAPARKTRKLKGGEAFDAEQVEKDTNISGDNPLFNAIINPTADLQSTVEDFLESLTLTPEAALAELVNCILRVCGCNNTIDSDQVADYDGVVDVLEDVTDALKKDDSSAVYPLTSKLPAFKKFRKSLSEFFERLVSSSAELGKLYNTELMRTMQHWVTSMSSSQVRGFRHTATVIALEIETALSDVAAAVEKEAEVVGRQREGERKRKGANKANTSRDKELESKAAAVRDRRTKVSEYLKDFIDGVFVHRYRDTDWGIRVECIRALGLWFKRHPGHFLDGSYLRYIGWVFSDDNMHVRLEAVKALAGAYGQEDHISSLQTFTDRFKPRMIQMATGDTEISVRVAVIQVLGAIDGSSLLDDDERETLCLLVFDEEPKVRKAVSNFVKGVWEDTVEERLVGRKAGGSDTKRAGVKALATLLVKWGKALDKLTIGEEKEDNSECTSQTKPLKEVTSILDPQKKGRTALAVEVLWDEIDPVSDWESLLDVLLLDHSAPNDEDDAEPSYQSRRKGKKGAKEATVDNAWRLDEVEEAVILEVFVASIRKALAEAAGAKKGEDEKVSSDITRALIKGLPRLFIKHQTDESRIADVLLIPSLMNLELYLEMRMMTAYEILWNDVTKQFLSHSSQTVLLHAVMAIQKFISSTSLSNTNNTKILELEDELATSLRDAVASRDELELAHFSEDEVSTLSHICARLAVFARIRNMISWLEEDEGGKQSSAWDILSALGDRGRLGYREEETMVSETLSVLTVHVIWKTKTLPPGTNRSPEEERLADGLMEQRASVLEKLVEYAVGTNSNTVEGVRRAAFLNLMDLHILFGSSGATPDVMDENSISLILDDETQYRCAGFVQAEIERFKDHMEELYPTIEEDEADASEDDGSETEAPSKKTKKPKTKKQKTKARDKPRCPQTAVDLQREHVFIRVVLTFLRAINANAIHYRHGAVLLSHYQRLVPPFDICAKSLVEVLRNEGIFSGNGQSVSEVIIQALRESYTMVLDGVERSSEASVALAKALASCFLVRGAQLSVLGRLDNNFIIGIHTALLTWIGKRLGTFESNGNKQLRNTAADFFRVLLPLLSTVDSRDALKIKAHMEQILAQAKVKILPTSKVWDAQRAYEKKLVTLMSKDKAGAKAKKTKGKTVRAVDTGSSDEGEVEESEVENVLEKLPTRKSARTRPTSKSKYRPAPEPVSDQEDVTTDFQTEPEDKPEEEDDIEEEPQEEEPEVPVTPKALRTYHSRTNSSSLQITKSSRMLKSQLDITPGPAGTPSRKRPRAEDEAEDVIENDNVDEMVDGGGAPSPTQESEMGEVVIKRKRIRR